MSDKSKLRPLKRAKSSKRIEKEFAVRGSLSNLLNKWYQIERLKWFILLVLSLITSILIFPNILSKTKTYHLGDVADLDVKASRDFLIEDKELTEKNMEKAVKEVLSVYDFDNSASHLIPRIKEAFLAGREYHTNIQSMLDQEGRDSADGVKNTSNTPAETDSQIRNRFFSILEVNPDEGIFDPIMTLEFSDQIEQIIILCISEVFERGVVGNRPMLKDHIEKGGIILHDIDSKKDIPVTNLNRFYDLEGAKEFIETKGRTFINNMGGAEPVKVSVTLAQALVKPNLTFNQRETEARKDLARKSVKPTYYKIKKGEMLVREGELIDADHLLKLSEQARIQSRMSALARVPAMTILIALLFSVMYLVGFQGTKSFKGEGKDLLFSSMMLFGIFVFILIHNFIAEEVARGFEFFTVRTLLFAVPVACGAMLISIFQGIGVAVTFSLSISVLGALLTGGQVEFFIYFFISNLVAAYGARSCTERGVLIKTGLMVGVVNIILSLAIVLIYGPLHTLEPLLAAASGFIGGILAGVIATGILPLIEMAFGFTTDIKLLELANLDQPLFRDFMVRSPGSYHHSVIIGNMVEATAKAVQANPLLARVSAYYHDIGKMKKPLYFIENQRGPENRHEKLAPSMSSLVLISHVKDGVELARKYKLGQEIIDIIQQHHGTSLISFFYHKAKERMLQKGDKSTEIKEEDFRYPGPKPQTKEAGLVMLADIVEAASRSLKDPTPARIQGMVQTIINKAFSDGQLDECELTLKDLHEIAKSFNTTLSGIFHHRVQYPEVVAGAKKRAKNGNSDQIPSENSRAKQSEDNPELENGLKRLGLS
jgi:putative nucleotidyltransferase with HDIG domain